MMITVAYCWNISSLTGPLATHLSTKYGCRKVVVFGGLTTSAGFVLSAFVPSLPYLYATFGLAGKYFTPSGFEFQFSGKAPPSIKSIATF